MTDTCESVSLLAQAFPDMLFGVKVDAIKIMGGNVIIKLSESLDDQFLLPEGLLADASERFRARFKYPDLTGARKLRIDGTVVNIYEYTLAFVDQTFCLTSENDKSIHQPSPSKHASLFHTSELVDGYMALTLRVRDQSCDLFSCRRNLSIEVHKMLFFLLCHQPYHMACIKYEDEFLAIVEAVAIAEYWDLLPVLREQLTALLTEKSRLWDQIATRPEDYLRLSVRLESGEIFADALRHYVGRASLSSRWYPLSGGHRPDLPPKILEVVITKIAMLQARMKILERELRGMALYTFQASSWKVSRSKAEQVRTTWLAARPNLHKSLSEICSWLANSIYREVLDQRIQGCSHRSHLRYHGSGRKDGYVRAGSLRIACEQITAASKDQNSTAVFGAGIGQIYSALFPLSNNRYENPAFLITKHLKDLVRNANQSINFWFPGKGPYANNHDHPRVWSSAHHDDGLEFFTFLPVDDSDFPWVGKKPFGRRISLGGYEMDSSKRKNGDKIEGDERSMTEGNGEHIEVDGDARESDDDTSSSSSYEPADEAWLHAVGLH